MEMDVDCKKKKESKNVIDVSMDAQRILDILPTVHLSMREAIITRRGREYM